MQMYKKEIIVTCIIILIMTYIIPAPKILHYGVIAFLVLSGLPSMGRNEDHFYENQNHDDELKELEEEIESKTDYSALDSCFFDDDKKSKYR